MGPIVARIREFRSVELDSIILYKYRNLYHEINLNHQKIVEEFQIDLTATQTAIRAGYSAKTAYSHGEAPVEAC